MRRCDSAIAGFGGTCALQPCAAQRECLGRRPANWHAPCGRTAQSCQRRVVRLVLGGAAWQRRAPRRHELTSRSLPGPRRAPAGCVFAVGHRHAPNGAMEAVAVSAAVNEAVGRSRACFAEQSKNWAVDETKARAVGASRRFTS